jgi:hypothetical protein
MEEDMKMTFRTAVIATSAFACAALMSPTWSEQDGLSLSVENAQARVGRPLTPVSVAGVARRQTRRAVYGAGVVGAGAYAAGAYYGGGGPYAYTGQTYGGSMGSGYACQPGTLYHGPDGLMRRC